ncbi:hypothetical protein CHS0354_002355 [Potamilus streckersoni]|uniref:MAM domain-containing protein n=1 Tax=Potamilus streckersoni TaxID=2493646 RepID=A0AAE0SNC9_9BIVA|nr:hypothetical protein CHS0354_002355 [Potamilus streckersoni]
MLPTLFTKFPRKDNWTEITGLISCSGTTTTSCQFHDSRSMFLLHFHCFMDAYYVYVEATGHTNQVARLLSKDYPGGDYCVDFFYNMYGSNMGYLQLNVMAGVQHIPLRKWTGNHGDQWYNERMNVHVQTSGFFEFEFEGHVGTGQYSDIAIDDITIHPGTC